MPQWKQFSGMWTTTQQMQAIAAGTWTGIPTDNLYAWGYNAAGRLGLNDTANRSNPVQVGDLTWEKSAASNFSLAIKTDGTLWAWGTNDSGQLGQNNTIYRSSPVQIGALTTWLQIAAGGNYGFAISTNGTLWAWGNNGTGNLGLNSTGGNRSSPVQVGALTNWSKISSGTSFTLAIKTDNTLWSWGRNKFFNGVSSVDGGQLGLNDANNRSSPVQIGALTDWLDASAGNYHALAIKTNGTLWSWGVNGSGQLGQNINYAIYRSSPVQVGALTTWAKVNAGSNFSMAVKTDGTLWAWGANSNGQLGQNNTSLKSSPVQVGALTTWANITSAVSSSLAIKTDGTLWSWGINNFGQLGQNNTTTYSSPVQVGSLNTWISLSRGETANHILAINRSTT